MIENELVLRNDLMMNFSNFNTFENSSKALLKFHHFKFIDPNTNNNFVIFLVIKGGARGRRNSRFIQDKVYKLLNKLCKILKFSHSFVGSLPTPDADNLFN